MVSRKPVQETDRSQLEGKCISAQFRLLPATDRYISRYSIFLIFSAVNNAKPRDGSRLQAACLPVYIPVLSSTLPGCVFNIRLQHRTQTPEESRHITVLRGLRPKPRLVTQRCSESNIVRRIGSPLQSSNKTSGRSSSAMPTSLDGLPVELISQVICFIDSKSDLISLARCSQQLHAMTVPYLYADIAIIANDLPRSAYEQYGELTPYYYLRMMACCFFRHPEYARHVRQLTLRWDEETDYHEPVKVAIEPEIEEAIKVLTVGGFIVRDVCQNIVRRQWSQQAVGSTKDYLPRCLDVSSR